MTRIEIELYDEPGHAEDLADRLAIEMDDMGFQVKFVEVKTESHTVRIFRTKEAETGA